MVVGLQSNWRTLEAQAKGDLNHEDGVVIIFCCREALPTPAADAFLILVATASKSPEGTPIRIVSVSEKTELSLASSLGLARAALVGITRRAKDLQALVEFVHGSVAPVDISWIGPEASSTYMPLRIETTLVPVKNDSKKAKPSVAPAK